MLEPDRLVSASLNDTHLNHQILVSQHFKYVYIVNLRVASTSIRHWLVQNEMAATGQAFSAERIRFAARDELDTVETLGIERVCEMINDPEYFVFKLVRDPFARTVSTFLKKKMLSPQMLHRLEALHRDYDLPFDSPLDFDRFLIFLAHYRPRGAECNRHWLSQSATTFSGAIDTDFTGRFEDMDTFVETVAARTGLDPDIFPVRAKTPESQKTGLEPTLVRRALVKAIYKDDYLAYGYP